MRLNLPLTVTILKMTTLLFTFLVMCLSAAFIVLRRNYSIMLKSIIEVSNPAANGLIASSVFNIFYFSYYLVFLFIRPESIFISMIVDTSFLGFLFLFSIGATGSMTAQAPYFGNCNHAGLGGHCGVGQGAIAFGWFTTLLILGLLAFQVAYTLVHYGKDMETWKTPFNLLLMYGTKTGGGGGGGGGRKSSGSGSGAGEGKYDQHQHQHQHHRGQGTPGSYESGYGTPQEQPQRQGGYRNENRSQHSLPPNHYQQHQHQQQLQTYATPYDPAPRSSTHVPAPAPSGGNPEMRTYSYAPAPSATMASLERPSSRPLGLDQERRGSQSQSHWQGYAYDQRGAPRSESPAPAPAPAPGSASARHPSQQNVQAGGYEPVRTQ